MKNTSLKIFKLLIVTDILLAVSSLILFDIKIFWNTQVGFLSATLVMIASMISYRRMVNARVENEVITTDIDKDVIDKLEDPYDLYSEEVRADEHDEKEFAEVVKEEKKKLKENRRTLFEVLKDTKAALSIYRLAAYAVLILGFLFLHRHGLLHIPSYVIALGLPPVIIVTILIRNKSQDAVE